MSFNNALRQLKQEDLNFILKNGKRSSILLNFDFKDLTLSSYGFIKEDVIEAFKTGDVERMLLKAFKDRGINVFHYEINNIPAKDVLSFVCWIKDELEVIARLEQEYLSSEPDFDLLASGIEKLNQFGITNVIDTLAGGDILKWNEIKKLPYYVIFDKQYKTVIEKGIEKSLVKIREAKNKSK